MDKRSFGVRLFGTSLLLAGAASLPALAQTAAPPDLQQLQQQASAMQARQMRDQGFTPTRADTLNQSLEQLLNARYGIVSTQQAPAGQALTLRDPSGQKWVLCMLAPLPPQPGQPGNFASLCRSLN
jgi:hypothetical protein